LALAFLVGSVCSTCTDSLKPTCSSGQVCCEFGATKSGMCVDDLKSNAIHCGKCSNDCQGGMCCNGVCKQQTDSQNCGTCGTRCASGTTCCHITDYNCVNLNTDGSNCGSCGTPCMGGKTCQIGGCVDASGTPDPTPSPGFVPPPNADSVGQTMPLPEDSLLQKHEQQKHTQYRTRKH